MVALFKINLNYQPFPFDDYANDIALWYAYKAFRLISCIVARNFPSSIIYSYNSFSCSLYSVSTIDKNNCHFWNFRLKRIITNGEGTKL